MIRLGSFIFINHRTLARYVVIATVSLVLASTPVAFGQFGMGGGGMGGGGMGGGGMGGGGMGGGGMGGGGGGGNTIGGSNSAGVTVDANGVLRTTIQSDPTGQLSLQRARQAWVQLDADIRESSKLRKVSLTRLENVLAQRLLEGGGADDEMQHLAGLTRIEYVFCYPDTGDIVIAGPAEAWGQAPSGRILGLQTGRPTLLLEDLVVALRLFAPGEHHNSPLIYCSIDPTADGLARMQSFLRRFGSRATPNQTQYIVEQLRDRLGKQVITIGGVSANTHFAQVLVEADYRMKLIGIDLEQPPVRLKSYVDRANPAKVARNALVRWYFVPDYECVRVSDDALAMQIEGDGVKLVGEDEIIHGNGRRQGTKSQNRASKAFVRAFTKVYPKLSQKAPVFAQLRNCIDMAVTAAFIQHQDYYGLVGWKPEILANEQSYAVETYIAPLEVASAVNGMWKGTRLVTPIGGGVQIRATEAVSPTNILADEDGSLDAVRLAVGLGELDPQQWWWD